MKNAFIFAGLLLTGISPSQHLHGQVSLTTKSGTETFTITEPGRIKLADLYKVADVVAVVRIVSGDSESYEVPIYKAVVLKSFKGASEGATIYFGPFLGERLGSEYTLFLRDLKLSAVPKAERTQAYGTVSYLEVFNQGYTSLENSYECLFDGSVPGPSCDYGVRVCTDYIVLPKEVRTFTSEKDDPPFGCRWVRRSRFMDLLDDFAEKPGVLRSPYGR
jgi:hypothetical protein